MGSDAARGWLRKAGRGETAVVSLKPLLIAPISLTGPLSSAPGLSEERILAPASGHGRSAAGDEVGGAGVAGYSSLAHGGGQSDGRVKPALREPSGRSPVGKSNRTGMPDRPSWIRPTSLRHRWADRLRLLGGAMVISLVWGGLASIRGVTALGAELTTFGQLDGLTRERAVEGASVKIRGVITFADPDWNWGFIQGDGGASFVLIRQPGIRSGQWVRPDRQHSGWRFCAFGASHRDHGVGATNLPAPARVDLQDLSTGSLDSQWVQTEGVVRRIYRDSDRARLSLTTRMGRFGVVVPGYENRPLPTNLVDTLVSVRGACTADSQRLVANWSV